MSPSLFSSLRNRLSGGLIATSASTLLPASFSWVTVQISFPVSLFSHIKFSSEAPYPSRKTPDLFRLPRFVVIRAVAVAVGQFKSSSRIGFGHSEGGTDRREREREREREKLATPPKNLENIFPPFLLSLLLRLLPGNQRVSRQGKAGQTDRNPNQSSKMLLFRRRRERGED